MTFLENKLATGDCTCPSPAAPANGTDQINRYSGDRMRALIVDDDSLHRKLLREILAPHNYEIEEALSGETAIAMIAGNKYDVVLLDKQLPRIGGDEICRYVREVLKDHLLPLIVITGFGTQQELSRSLSAGANDYIAKPINPLEVISRVNAAATRKRLTDQLDNAESMLFSLARMVEAKDEDTGDHCSRLSHLSAALGRDLGLSAHDIRSLEQGGVLHDIGKLGIPDSILLKKDALTEVEWEKMRQHPLIGAGLCDGLKSIQGAVPIIRYHHEKWDGSGYPHGIGGNEIPLVVRVFQLADIYDALANERSYKKAFTTGEIIDIFTNEIGHGWRDPELGHYFLDVLRNRPQLLATPEIFSIGAGARPTPGTTGI